MKVDIKSEVVQWMLRTWLFRLTNIPLNIMAFDALLLDEGKLWPLDANGFLDIPAQRYEMFFKSCKLNQFEFFIFWLEFFSQKKYEALAKEALGDTHLPLCIENEVAKDKWLKWLAALDLSDKKNGEILAGKCFFVGLYLTLRWLEATEEEMELQSFQNIESVCFELVKEGSIFIKYNYTIGFLKTMAAKRSASHKTVQAEIKQAQIEAIYREHGCKSKGSKNFYIKAMQKTGWTEDYIKRKVKEMKNTACKTDGIP